MKDSWTCFLGIIHCYVIACTVQIYLCFMTSYLSSTSSFEIKCLTILMYFLNSFSNRKGPVFVNLLYNEYLSAKTLLIFQYFFGKGIINLYFSRNFFFVYVPVPYTTEYTLCLKFWKPAVDQNVASIIHSLSNAFSPTYKLSWILRYTYNKFTNLKFRGKFTHCMADLNSRGLNWNRPRPSW